MKYATVRQKELGKTHGEDPCDNFVTRGLSREQAGKTMGVSGAYVQEVKRIKEEDPEAFQKIKSGKATFS